MNDQQPLSPYEMRQELRQCAKDLNFEIQQLVRRVDDLKLMLYGTAREIRREDRTDQHAPGDSRERRHLRKSPRVRPEDSR